MGYLVAPSDITVIENKVKLGRRHVGIYEWIGSFYKPPMLHSHYSKMSGWEKYAVLTKRFDANATQPEIQLCIARQNAIKRDVIGAIGSVWGAALGGGLSLWSTRKYYGKIAVDKIAAVPIAYMFSYPGRWAMDVLTGYASQSERDRWLGELPAKTYVQ